MVSKFLLIALLFPLFLRAGEKTYTLDLRQNPTLKTVYAAGMTPWRITDDSCMLGGAGAYSLHQVTATFPGSTPFTFPAESIGFHVFSDYQLSDVDLTTLPIPLAEAKKLAQALCEALKLPIGNLDTFFASLDEKNRWSEYWTADSERDGIQFHLLCMPIPRMNETLAQVTLSAKWVPGTSAERSKRMLLTPMEPPEGYRHISMAIPTPAPGQKQLPEHDPQYYLDLIEKAKKKQAR